MLLNERCFKSVCPDCVHIKSHLALLKRMQGTQKSTFAIPQPVSHDLRLNETPVVDFIFLLGLMVDDNVGLIGSQLLNLDFLLHCTSCKWVNKYGSHQIQWKVHLAR
ncbi:hypothetical protein AMECASPLE_031624 [Ameca splendens]|uniref:Uncharacterized protein n=1 Tax=Ameca splendens TaxID=208324 RepID=A0ABV0ZSQ6_9TELE